MAKGDIERVNALLGYTYRSQGTVIEGRRLGRKIGFPTLNLPWSPECAPQLGVYAVELTKSTGSKVWRGVANYGVRPTVSDGAPPEPVLEVHLFETPDFSTGTELQVDWCSYLRAEKRFDNIEVMRDQITMDRGAAMQWFER